MEGEVATEMPRKRIPFLSGTIVLDRIRHHFGFLETELNCAVTTGDPRDQLMTYALPTGGEVWICWGNTTPPQVFLCKPSYETPPRTNEKCYGADGLAQISGRDELVPPHVPKSQGLTIETLEKHLELQASAVREFARDFLHHGDFGILGEIAKQVDR
jgi:hypothetical protein